MRNRLLALALSGLAFGVWAGPAMADEPPVNAQVAEQVAGSVQNADSSATSTQYQPSNQNISVRVLSPGDAGSVTQTNESVAESFAGNHNETEQAVEQTQTGTGSTAVQEAAQKAGSVQHASSEAESVQVKPSNQNISVRVLSPGDDGDVEQTNSSKAKSGAVNANETAQGIAQSQGGSGKPTASYDAHEKDGCDCDSTGIQAAGQEAFNKQKAESEAKSVQIKPSNQNIAVRVLSPGDDGKVEQTNSSAALSKALNHNSTTQAIEQDQGGSRCGCHGATAIQAAGQAAFNWQDADSSAESKQIKPENKAKAVRFKSHGDGGALTQTNASAAFSLAANWNELEQLLAQRQDA